jgi:hypothetical protein
MRAHLTWKKTASTLLLAACFGAIAAQGASAATIVSSFVNEVQPTSAALRAEINPLGQSTSYRFEYLLETLYLENLKASKEAFTGSAKVPAGLVTIGSGSSPVSVFQHLSGLKANTPYRYRVTATSTPGGTVVSPARPFATREPAGAFQLPEGRAWEIVSPVNKEGGSIQGPEQNFGGGAFQAAPDGNTFTYSSADSFAGGVGAPPASQYIARRGGSGWQSENITTALLSGSYGNEPDGVPYRLFSTGISAGLLSNGERCRGEAGSSCPVANPPLPGSGAPPGYRDYYLRNDASGSYEALVKSTDFAHSKLTAEELELTLAGASPDLSAVVLSSCAALTANAVEVSAGGGCNEGEQNLYRWTSSGLTLVNLLPAGTVGTPGAELAAPAGAVSSDGSRIYFTLLEDGGLYLREGGQTKLVAETVGGGAAFQVASSDGRYAFFRKGGHLYRYDANSGASTDLTPLGGVSGVFGAAANGSSVYFEDAEGIREWTEGGVIEVVSSPSAASSSDFPPATGTARVSPDGSHLAFLSDAELTGYDNQGETELYVYGPPAAGGEPQLICASCRPSGERPQGEAAIPGAVANGSTQAYKPRALNEAGTRLFFDTSDSLVLEDTDSRVDVYEWRAQGVGGCARPLGCVALLSSGRGGADSSLVDASADGADAYFLTEASLVSNDPGAYDVYDARIGGGFPLPAEPVPCTGDACQVLPAAPEDPSPGTLLPGRGNPALHIVGKKKKTKKHHKHHKKKHHKHKGGKSKRRATR